MKCTKCSSEWNGTRELDNCPFCGGNLKPQPKEKDFQTVEEVFGFIFSKFGVEIINDRLKFVSVFSDLAPNLAREGNLISLAVEAGIYKEMFSVNKSSDAEKRQCLTVCKLRMQDKYFMQPEWAEKVILWFADYLGWKIVQQTTAQPDNSSERKGKTQIIAIKEKMKDSSDRIIKARQDIEKYQGLISTNNNPFGSTLGLKSDGTVVAAGYGQCNVSSWKDIVAVSAGEDHTVGLKKDGTVVALGNNDCGQCKVKRWKDIIAISVRGSLTAGLKKDGTVVLTKGNDIFLENVKKWKEIVAVSVGGNCIVGLKKDGTVVAVGITFDPRIDRFVQDTAFEKSFSSWKDIIAISIGGFHVVGLKKDGTVVTVGINDCGQCNVSSWKDVVAISANREFTVGVKLDGTVVVAGDNGHKELTRISSWKDIVAVSAGNWRIVGLKKDGSVVEVGWWPLQADISSWKLF